MADRDFAIRQSFSLVPAIITENIPAIAFRRLHRLLNIFSIKRWCCM